MSLALVKDKEPEKNERKCKNWMETWEAFTAPRSESPISILRWCGFFTMASVLRRNVKIGKKYLGGWECYPHLYVIFVGPQGSIKKSTTIGFGEDVLDELEELNLSKCPEAVTTADLMKRLMEANDSSVYMLLSEFSLLPLKAGPGIYDMLTKLFDGAKKIDEGTIGRGYMLANNPCLNMLGATTPKWVAANMSEDIIGGGFGSRVIFIHETEVRQRRLLHNKLVALDHIEILKKNLVDDLRHLASIKGDFELTEQAQLFIEDWYQKNAVAPAGTDSRMLGFYNRKPAHILKLAMLLHLAHSDSLILDVNDFEEAIKEIEEIEPKILATFKNVGRNVYAADIRGISKFIKDRCSVSPSKSIKKSDVLQMFNAAAEPHKLEELISHIRDMGEIKINYVNGEWYLEHLDLGEE